MYARTLLLSLSLLFVMSCEKEVSKTQDGTFSIDIGGEPTTLNPITGTDGYTTSVKKYVLETLLESDSDTFDWKPGLADKWEISPDKKTFTFKLREGAKWHDGKPVTAEDVKYSFDVIFDPEMKTAHIRPYYENISKVEIIDPMTVKFTVKDDYFQNFDVAASLYVVPKHYYSDASKKKEHNRMMIGSGPYKLASYDKGKRIVLEQNPEWWGRKDPKESMTYNFPRIVMRFIKEENVSLESFKKGDLDMVALRPESYTKKTDGPGWGEKYFKVKTVNRAPKGYTFIGWNMKHPVLSDQRVRKALAMLFNRKLAQEKFEYNLSDYADGPEVPVSEFHSPNLKPVEFNPDAALKALKAAGWNDTDSDSVLDKVIDGKKTPLSVTILEPLADYVKYLTIYKEEAKKVGVEINIKQIEWNSFMKLIDERKFDAVRLAWGGGEGDPDPKQIWHSASAAGGSNFIQYNNPEVDKLIDKYRKNYNRQERIKIYQTIGEKIAADDPYLFIFAGKNTLYAHSNRIQKSRDTYNYEIGIKYWTLAK